jgi:hypothetical protein
MLFMAVRNLMNCPEIVFFYFYGTGMCAGVLQRELAVHTNAVKGLEWTTGKSSSIF